MCYDICRIVVDKATTMDEILKKFGLTKNESAVYLGVHHNPLLTGVQLSRILRMDKSSTYKALDSLRSKGLLITSPGQKGIVYKANSPDTLLGLAREKEIELKGNILLLNEFVKKLKIDKRASRDTYFTIEYGIDALKFRMDESLETKEKFIRERFRYIDAFNDPSYVEFIKKHAHRRVDKRIMILEIDAQLERMDATFKGMLRDRPNSYKQVRVLPERFDDNNSIRIWDNTVNIISYDENNEFIIITLKDKYIAELMKNFYDFLWDHCTVYSRREK